MNGYLTVLSIVVFFALLSVAEYIRVFQGEKCSSRLRLATIISYAIAITNISLITELSMDIKKRIYMWVFLITISVLITSVVSIITNHKRNFFISFAIMSLFNLIGVINVFFMEGWNMVFNYYFICYELSIYSFIIIFSIKRDSLSILLLKILIGFYAFHSILHTMVYYTNISNAVVEMILFLIFGNVVSLPIFLLIMKRVKRTNENEVKETYPEETGKFLAFKAGGKNSGIKAKEDKVDGIGSIVD